MRLNVSRAKKHGTQSETSIIFALRDTRLAYDIEEYIMTDVGYDDATIIKAGPFNGSEGRNAKFVQRASHA